MIARVARPVAIRTAEKVCHPERLKKIHDFRKESKDLRTDLLLCRP